MRISFILLLIFASVGIKAQKKKISREEYVETYKSLAIKEMERTGIPASITLAQGILESGNGNSRLAVKANNHFGIKCHDWKGPSVRHDDDKRNECFRKYKSAERSYLDHSDFLVGKSRYASLFELKPGDYKAWAKGLKKAGYATSPTYSQALIKIIEENELHKYDEVVLASSKGNKRNKNGASDVEFAGVGKRQIKYNNRVKYIIADSNDTYESLSEELFMLSWQLPKYNGRVSGGKLTKGELVYLQPKRKKAASGNTTHKLKAGETTYSVSQLYGIKEEALRHRNLIPEGNQPAVGAILLLRGKQKGAVPLSKHITREKTDEESPEFEVEIDLGS